MEDVNIKASAVTANFVSMANDLIDEIKELEIRKSEMIFVLESIESALKNIKTVGVYDSDSVEAAMKMDKIVDEVLCEWIRMRTHSKR